MVRNDDTGCTNYYKGQKWAGTIDYMTSTIDKLTGTIVNLSMKKVAIPNLDIQVFNRESDLPQGNFLRSLTQPKITRQRHFKLTDIEYDRIKNKIARMEHADYNTDIKINVLNVDDMEDVLNV